jgi:hypothetical protein
MYLAAIDRVAEIIDNTLDCIQGITSRRISNTNVAIQYRACALEL